jgi:hypothetical protein
VSGVFLLGSRSLPSAGWGVCRLLAARLARSGFSVSVGCAPGADLAFVSALCAVPGAAARLSVFAVGGPSGAGFPSPSVSLPVLRRAVSRGARVSWWAGGPAAAPLVSRLPARSSAALASVVSGGGLPRVAFGVVSSPSSRGSFRSLRLAAAAGLSCFVVPVGFSPRLLPRLGAGCWVRASFLGVPCFRWLPAGV